MSECNPCLCKQKKVAERGEQRKCVQSGSSGSRVVQRKRAGPIILRSEDQNLALLLSFFVYISRDYFMANASYDFHSRVEEY